MDTIYDITLAIYPKSTLYAYFKLVCYLSLYQFMKFFTSFRDKSFIFDFKPHWNVHFCNIVY